MPQRGPTAGSELREVLVEVGCHRAEHRLITQLFLLAQLGDQLLEVAARGADVIELNAQGLEALLELAAFRFRQGIRRSDLLQATFKCPHLFLARLAARDLFW